MISGNSSIGIEIYNSVATSNLVEGNLIGTNEDGTRALLEPNPTTGFPIGVFINDSPANTIGGTMSGAGNVFAGFGVGVNVAADGATGNAIEGNRIGTDRDGNVLTNSIGIGIYINGAGQNTVGGPVSGAGNLIMGYSDYGVYLFGSLSTGNVIQGDLIGHQSGKPTARRWNSTISRHRHPGSFLEHDWGHDAGSGQHDLGQRPGWRLHLRTRQFGIGQCDREERPEQKRLRHPLVQCPEQRQVFHAEAKESVCEEQHCGGPRVHRSRHAREQDFWKGLQDRPKARPSSRFVPRFNVISKRGR